MSDLVEKVRCGKREDLTVSDRIKAIETARVSQIIDAMQVILLEDDVYLAACQNTALIDAVHEKLSQSHLCYVGTWLSTSNSRHAIAISVEVLQQGREVMHHLSVLEVDGMKRLRWWLDPWWRINETSRQVFSLQEDLFTAVLTAFMKVDAAAEDTTASPP